MTATIRDVAQRAGVSTATVSRVLNKSGHVEPDTVAKVEQAVRALNYRRNLVARGLRMQRSHLLSLLCSDIENPFFTSICRGIEDVASASGYAVLICNTDGDLGKERDYIQMLNSQSVSGVIVSPTSTRGTDIGPLLQQQIAVVAVDRELRHQTDEVFVDNRLGAFEATRHLIQSGATRIACITGPRAAMTAQDRLSGYRQALEEHGLEFDPKLTRFADFKDTGGHAAAKELMQLRKPPDALFVGNNRMTTGALLALKDLDVRIPEDVLFVGFDDLPWADLVTPTITTVRQPTYEMGRAAAEMLLRRIGGDAHEEPRRLILNPELVVRASSRRAIP